MGHQELQDVYGFPDGDNPYTPRALNPLQEPEHSKLIVRMQPFDVLDQVEAYLKQCAQDGTTAFVLVTGESGTGRSSVANVIVACYRAQLISDCAKRKSRFFLPPLPALNEDPFSVYFQWVNTLRNDLYFGNASNAPLNPPDGFFDRLEKEVDRIDRARGDYGTRFAMLLGNVSILLCNQGDPAGFGLLMEGVPNPSFVHVARDMFRHARAVCVFTAPDSKPEVASAFRNAFSDGSRNLVALKGIRGETVRKVLEARWNGRNGPPFDKTDIQRTFQDPHPIGKVLYIVSELLNVRAHEKKDAAWPDATPGFTESDLRWGFEHFGKGWRLT